MQIKLLRAFFYSLFVALAVFLNTGKATAAATDAATAVISPADAGRAIGVLENGGQRAEAVRTLKTIAAVSPASAAAAASAAEAAEAAQEASAASSTPAIEPLAANGLIAQLLRQVNVWAARSAHQVQRVSHAALEVPSFVNWWRHTTGTDRGRKLLLTALWCSLAAIGGGLVLEWCAARLLQRPRRALLARADDAEHHAKRREAVLTQRRDRAAAEIAGVEGETTPAEGLQSQAGTRAVDTVNNDPNAQPVIVKTQVNGETKTEALIIDDDGARKVSTQLDDDAPPDAGAATRPGASETSAAGAGLQNAGPQGAAPPDASAPAPHGKRSTALMHWGLLRHLPLALAGLVLDVVPLAVFFVVAGVTLNLLAGDTGPVAAFVTQAINIYVIARIVMAVMRLIVSPTTSALRLVPLGDARARYLQRWMRAMVATTATGMVLVEAIRTFGGSEDASTAVSKLTALVVHLCLLVIVAQCARPVGDWIRQGRPGSPLNHVRGWLADIWAFVASFFIIALWLVWALGVENGFPKLLRFAGLSAAVIVGARLVSILAYGGLARALHGGAAGETVSQEKAEAAARAARYYSALRSILSFVITLATILMLLEVWGVDAFGWLTQGPVGRRLTSATLTIAVAAAAAIVVWEAANLGIDRRLRQWSLTGDTVRAARLRTLLPMLRAALFIVILLVVGLTTLSQIGINTTPLVAGVSIVGAAITFGSQKLVQDFITGIFLLMENAMQVGDWVTVAGVSGSVEYLSLRTVRLRAGDGSLHTIPFSSVSTVNNVNRGIGNAAIKLVFDQSVDLARALALIKRLGAELRADDAFKDMILNDLELWGVDQIDGATITVVGQIRCLDRGRWGVQREFNARAFDLFRAEGIALFNPQTRSLSGTLINASAPAEANAGGSGAPTSAEGDAATTVAPQPSSPAA